MTPERFETLLAAYGAEPRRWPEPERAAALALLAGDARMRAALARERRLDLLLDGAATPRATPMLVARLSSTPRRLRVGFATQIAAMAAAAALGLFVGWSSSAPSDQAADEQWSTLLLGDWDEG